MSARSLPHPGLPRPFTTARPLGGRLTHGALRIAIARRNAHRSPRSALPRRGVVAVVAHGNHSHGHSHDHDHSHSHDHSCSHSHGHDHGDLLGFGHSHGPQGAANPLHGALLALLAASRLSPLIHWLEGNVVSSVAKIALFAGAAAAAAAAGGAPDAAAAAALRRASAAATAGVFALAGVPAAIDLALDLAALRIDTHVLMNLAVVGTLITGFPLEGALLLVLFQTSHTVEHALTERAQGNLQALYDAVPDHAEVVRLGGDGAPALATARRVLAEEVAVGEVMLVKPGGQVPLDGVVVHGRALVSAEHLTGEALPALRRPGDDVPAGALCHDGMLAVRATRVVDESTPARIARLARDAQARRPRLRTWLDAFGEWYSRAVVAATVVALGAMLAAGVPLLGAVGAERGALYRAMGLLTVASPCALVMVPLAYVSAIAAAASRGVVLKGGRVLDALDACRVVAVDKTGTLTTGRLRVRAAAAVGPDRGAGVDRRRALKVAAALSLRSTHPVSDAVVEEAVRAGLDASRVKVADFELVAGGGVRAAVRLADGAAAGGNGARGQTHFDAFFGSLDFVAPHLAPADVEALRCAGREGSSTLSVLVLATPGVGAAAGASAATAAVWAFTLEDSLRSVSSAAVEALQEGSWAGGGRPRPSRACRVVMLTGDNVAAAARIAGQLGIRDVMAGLSPEDKLRAVATLREGAAAAAAEAAESEAGRRRTRTRRTGVIMVGDGLNDAAALAAADVGVAIARSSATAATLAADAVVLSEAAGMASVPMLLRLARATRYVVAQNLALAAGSIAVLAAPTVLGFMPLWLAVMLHEGSTLLVALNSLRLLRFSAAAVGQGRERRSAAPPRSSVALGPGQPRPEALPA